MGYGKGRVLLGAGALGMARRKVGEETYIDAAGNRYNWNGGPLKVNDSLVIENFKNGDLGIYLDEEDGGPGGGGGRPGGGGGGGGAPKYTPGDSRRRMDPLALDLDGDGRIATVASTDSAAYFDFNDDGISERSGWIGSGEGLLALDANGNGVVDGLAELFGTAAQDGFGELAAHDSNNDGAIDARDTDYARLLVWHDADGDGVADAGELAGLEQSGIERIWLDARSALIEDGDNRISATARYEQRKTDGSGTEERLVADVEFAVDFGLTDSNPNRPLGAPPQLDAAVFDLPWLRGYGNVKSLHVAYQESHGFRQVAKLRPLRWPAVRRTSTEAILRPCLPERQQPCGSSRHGRADRRQTPRDRFRAGGFKPVPADSIIWSTPCSD